MTDARAAVLTPGAWILTTTVGPGRTPPEVLAEGLALAGLERVLPDLSGPHGEDGARFAFVVRAVGTFALERSDELTVQAVALPFDPYADVGDHLSAAALDGGHRYAFRFLSRMVLRDGRRVHAHDRPFVISVLEDSLRFSVEALSCMHANMRLPGLPNATHALWTGVARYEGPMSHLTDVEGGLLFETFVRIRDDDGLSPEEVEAEDVADGIEQADRIYEPIA